MKRTLSIVTALALSGFLSACDRPAGSGSK
jgi:predicted small secreted protein